MRTDDLAARRLDGLEKLPHALVQRLDARHVGIGALPVGLRMRGVGLGKGARDIARISRAIGQVLPRVRVKVAMMMMAMIMIMIVIAMLLVGVIEPARLDALGGHDGAAREAGGLLQARQPGFEIQSVDHQYLRGSQLAGVGRGRLVFVRVAIGAYQALHGHVRTAHLGGDIGEDGKAGDDLQGLGRGDERGQQDSGRQRQDARFHGRSPSGCHGRARRARRAATSSPPCGPHATENR